jgi:hypothetical protein
MLKIVATPNPAVNWTCAKNRAGWSIQTLIDRLLA